jgi:hypothetical protein
MNPYTPVQPENEHFVQTQYNHLSDPLSDNSSHVDDSGIMIMPQIDERQISTNELNVKLDNEIAEKELLWASEKARLIAQRDASIRAQKVNMQIEKERMVVKQQLTKTIDQAKDASEQVTTMHDRVKNPSSYILSDAMTVISTPLPKKAKGPPTAYTRSLASKASNANCSVICQHGEILAPRRLGVEWAACCTPVHKAPEPSTIYLELESHLLLSALRNTMSQIMKLERNPELIRALAGQTVMRESFDIEIDVLTTMSEILIKRIDFCSKVSKEIGFPGTLVAGCADLAEVSEQFRGMLIFQSNKINKIADISIDVKVEQPPEGVIEHVFSAIRQVWDYLRDLFHRISDAILIHAKSWMFSDAPLIAYYVMNYILPVGVAGLSAVGMGHSLPGVMSTMVRGLCPIIKSLPATLVLGKALVAHVRSAATNSVTGKLVLSLKGSMGAFGEQFKVMRYFKSATGVVQNLSVAALDDIGSDKADWFDRAIPWLITAAIMSIGSLFSGLIEGLCQTGSGATTFVSGTSQLFGSLLSGIGTGTGYGFEKVGNAAAQGAAKINGAVDTLNAGSSLRTKFASLLGNITGEGQGLLQGVMDAMGLLADVLTNGLSAGMSLFVAGVTGQSLTGIIFVGSILLLTLDHFLAPAVVQRLDAFEGLNGSEIDPRDFFSSYNGAPAADFTIYNMCLQDPINTRSCVKVTAEALQRQHDDAKAIALFNHKFNRTKLY